MGFGARGIGGDDRVGRIARFVAAPAELERRLIRLVAAGAAPRLSLTQHLSIGQQQLACPFKVLRWHIDLRIADHAAKVAQGDAGFSSENDGMNAGSFQTDPHRLGFHHAVAAADGHAAAERGHTVFRGRMFRCSGQDTLAALDSQGESAAFRAKAAQPPTAPRSDDKPIDRADDFRGLARTRC